MTQNIQDPELRDFVEESVVECFRYLNNSGRQEKCQFSQNLLTCLAEKGSEVSENFYLTKQLIDTHGILHLYSRKIIARFFMSIHREIAYRKSIAI